MIFKDDWEFKGTASLQQFNTYIQRLSRRAFVIFGLQAIGFCILGARIYYLQHTKRNTYEALSNRNRLRIYLKPPIRGIILDNSGRILAQGKRMFRVYILKQQKDLMLQKLLKIKNIIKLTDEQIEQALEKSKFLRVDTPVLVRENLNWREMSKLYVNKPILDGVEVSEGESRVYFYKDVFAHTIGYVGKVSKSDVKDNEDQLLYIPGFEIGKSGVEKSYRDILRGVAGTKQVEVNMRGQSVKTVESSDQQKGDNLQLSIDTELQIYIMKLLKPYLSASIVVMDIHTGAVRAMYSEPSFDPNLFVGGISHKNWNKIRKNKYSPLINKTTQGSYAPGSVFKMVVVLSALEMGMTTKDKSFCRGYTNISDRRYHCWKKAGHGRVGMVKSLRESCDIWYYEKSQEIGIDNIAHTARKFGLGETFDVGLDGQNTGLIPDKEWKKKRYNKNWFVGETAIAAIGQGYVLSTPLQLAVMTARIANGGKAVVPHIATVNKNGEPHITDFPDMDIEKEHLDIVKKGMYQVVNHYRGTAKESQTDIWTMAGKTGTSQVRTISMQERSRKQGVTKNEDLEWKYRDHSLFVGYAPYRKPRYAVSCVVEHGGSGSKAAAPLVRNVFDKIAEIEKTRKL